MKKLTKKQKIYIFAILLFVATWAGGIVGFLSVISLFLLAYLVDKKRKQK